MRKKVKKILAYTLVLFMVFGIFPLKIVSYDTALAATGFRHETVGGADVVLGGNYIEVGVSKGGSFGTANPAPSGFHPSPNATYQSSRGVGLRVDGDGFDTGNPPTTGDFFLPGQPEEGFTVGYKVNSASAGATNYTNAERESGDGISTITTDTTSGDTLSAATLGTTNDGNLAVQQNVSFKVNDKFFKTVIKYTNNGSNTLYDVRYMRSFDPDQDAVLHGVFETYNSVLENFPQDSRAIVRAEGGYTKEPVFFITTDSRARASAPTNGLCNRDPYSSSVYNADGSKLKTSEVLEDQPIALTFALGTLAPGQSTTFEYYTSLDPNYNSGISAIMGSLGLQINSGAAKTNNLNVTLNLNGTNVSQMCFSNDNVNFTDWETYASTKTWTLTSGKGTKTVYAKFKDATGSISQASASIDFNSIPTVSDGTISTTYQTSYNFATSDFTSGGKFSDADGDTLNQIKITALPTHGALKLNSSSVSLNQTIAYSDLSKIVYTPNNGYYGSDAFKWMASDGTDFSASEASMNITVQALPPGAPGVFASPVGGQIVKGGDSINISWGSVTSPSGSTVTYTLDYFNGSTWNNVYTGTSTSYNFSDTSGQNLNTAKFRVKASDTNGSSAYTMSNTFTIDSQAPSITSIDETPSAWTSSGVKITVDANDGMSGLADKPYSFDGGSTWQADNFKIYDSNTSGIVIKVKDKAGNIADYNAADITNIDDTQPNAPVIADAAKYTDSKWYNSAQTISAGFTKTDGCDEKLQYMVDSGAWTDGEQVTVSDEGKHTVNFRVIDSLGRTGSVQSVKVNIDNTAPKNAKITVNENDFTTFLNKITFGLFFNETENVSITADCDISGTNKIEYQKVSDESNYDADGTWTNGSSFSISPDDKYIIYARITDNAGNYVIINTDGIIVDASKPELDLTAATDSWSSGNVSVSVTASDALAGVKEVTYTTDESVPQTGTVALTDGKGTITLANEGQYKLTVTAKDNSLNEVTETENIKIDKSLPVINGVTGNPSDWTSNSVKLTVDAQDAVSGLADKPYSFDGGNTWQADNFKIYDSNTSGIVVEVKDNTGYVASYSPVDITKIDKTQPNAPVIADATKYTDSKWYNSAQTISASFTKTDGCDEKLQYMVDSGAWTDGEQVTVSDEGKHTVNFRVIDSLGRTGTVQSVNVNIDNTAPKNAKITVNENDFTTFLNKITFGLFFNETENVSITADCDISGTNKIEYQKVSDESNYDPNGTWTSGSSFSISPDDKCIIYARITDNAGNYVIINTDGIIVDASKPELDLTAATDNWTSENVSVSVTASDALAGVKEVTYTTDESVPQTGTVSLTDGKGTITLANEGQYKLTVTAKDNSLNEITETEDIKIDKSTPVINSVTGNPSDWTSNSVKLAVDANDAVSGLDAKPYSFDGGNTWQADNFKIYDSNTSGIVVEVKDNTGNVASYSPIDITKIDKTQPNAPVIADAAKYTDSKWYNSAQTISASFTKTDGCDEKLQYMVDSGAWTDGEQVTVSDEGKHTVNFRVIDSLGRTGTVQSVNVNIDNTAPKNAKITVNENDFTSFLNKITFGLFFNETENVSITADCDISGTNKIEYQKVSDESNYDADGTWTNGSSFSISPDDKCIIYARITDNAGNYVIINTDGIIVDASKPELDLAAATDSWSSGNVSVSVIASDALAGVKEVTYTTDESVPQTGTVALTDGKGTITLTNEGQYKLTVTAKDNSLNEVTETEDIKIDKSLPVINSVTGNPSDWTSNSVKLAVDAQDAVSGLDAKPYSFDGGNTWQADNFKIYDSNTSGIVVEVKDNTGNVASYSPIDITKIDKTQPNAPVIADAAKYTNSKWYNSAQTISAGFTKTDGCDEKLQYMVDSGAWTDGEQVTVSDEGKHTVNFRVIDSLGRTGSVQSVNVNIDNTAPKNAKITVKDNDFTSFLNKITFGLFFNETENVSITADCDISGTNKIEYQKVSDQSNYDPDGTWTNGSSFSISPDDKCIIYARITDNAGNYVIINTDGIIVDASKPELDLTAATDSWSSENVSVSVTASDALAGVKEVTYTTDESVPQTGTVSLTDGKGTITLTNEGQYKLTVTAKDNSLNEVTETEDIKIDKSLPVINGVTGNPADWTSNSVKLTVDAQDAVSGLDAKPYSFDGGNTWQADNFKIYDSNISGIVVQVKDNTGNVASYSPIDITKIDKTQPNAPVIADASKYTDSKWYNSAQTISAGFTRTDGCDEKLQYMVDSGAWTDGEQVTVSDEGKHTVSFRVIDSLGRTGTVQSVNVNIDNTAPKNIKITIKNNDFSTFLNKITFGLFFKETTDVSITADGNISGINHYEYQIVDTSEGQTYNENGTWKTGDSFSIQPQFKGIVYARAVDNAGNVSDVINSEGVVVDSVNPTAPSVQAFSDGSAYTGDWTANDILIKASGSTALSGINHYEYKAGADGQWVTMTQESGASDSVTGNIIKDETLINHDIADTYYIRAVSNSGTVSQENSVVIRRDSSVPQTSVTVSKGAAGTWTNNPVTFTVANTNGQSLAPVSFYVKAGSSDWVKMSENSCTFSNEMNQTVQFKTVTAAGLENVSQTSCSVQIDKTNPVISGAESSANYYIGRIIKVNDSWGQIGSAVYTKDGGKEVQLPDNGLISAPGKYNVVVTDKAGNKATLSFTINTLPAVSDIEYTDTSKTLIQKIRNEFNAHSDLPEPYKTDTDSAIKALESKYDELSLLKVYDKVNDATVTGIDGTVFAPGTYLVVTPITSEGDSTAVTSAENKLNEAAKTNSELKKKDLLALYDVSLFKDKIKIEPDGKVQVRIKIPAEYANRTGLDIIHVADDGTITVMHAKRDGDYLVFITDHFSQYGIIAKNTCWLGICNALGIYEKDGGVCYCWAFVLGAAVILAGGTAFIIYKKRKRKGSEQDEELAD